MWAIIFVHAYTMYVYVFFSYRPGSSGSTRLSTKLHPDLAQQLAEAATRDAAASDAGTRRLDAARIHDVARLVLRAVRIRRRNSRSVDTDRRVEAERLDGPRVCRDDGARVERSCGIAAVPVARGKTKVHVVGKGRRDATDIGSRGTQNRCGNSRIVTVVVLCFRT